jgi:hypothetical protein
VYQYAKHNFTVANFWAPFLVRHEMIDEDGPAHTGLWNLYLDEPDAVWSPRVAAFDYVVVSASSWFYRPSMLYEAGRLVGCYYCLRPNVTGLTLNYALRAATRTALRVLAGGGADGHHGRFRGTAVLRTVSPSQYENGGWNKDGDCVRSRPHQRGEKRMEGFELQAAGPFICFAPSLSPPRKKKRECSDVLRASSWRSLQPRPRLRGMPAAWSG